jgi:hypothetical protein
MILASSSIQSSAIGLPTRGSVGGGTVARGQWGAAKPVKSILLRSGSVANGFQASLTSAGSLAEVIQAVLTRAASLADGFQAVLKGLTAPVFQRRATFFLPSPGRILPPGTAAIPGTPPVCSKAIPLTCRSLGTQTRRAPLSMAKVAVRTAPLASKTGPPEHVGFAAHDPALFAPGPGVRLRPVGGR